MRPQSREARFTALYETQFEPLRAYAWRREPALADDIVSETFLVAWRRLDDVPDEAALPWLIGVARNVRLNLIRSERRRSVRDVQAAAAEPRHPEDVLPPGLDPALSEALAGVSPRDREVLFLAAWEDLDSASIARALGCSRATAAVRLHRARRRLTAALGADYPASSPTLGGASDAC